VEVISVITKFTAQFETCLVGHTTTQHSVYRSAGMGLWFPFLASPVYPFYYHSQTTPCPFHSHAIPIGKWETKIPDADVYNEGKDQTTSLTGWMSQYWQKIVQYNYGTL